MADEKMTVNSSVFELPITISASGDVVKTLSTKDTYIDKNIKVQVTTPDAELEKKDKGTGYNGEVSATASYTDSNGYLTTTENTHPITISADAHVNAVTIGVKTAGFASTDDAVTVDAAVATQDTKTLYIVEGSLSGSGTASAESTNVSLTGLTEAPTDGSFYIKAAASGSVKVTSAGWLDKDTSADANGDKYYQVKSLVFSNAATTGTTYDTVSVSALASGDYLYVNEGYTKDVKISLADLVPDVANITTEAAEYILTGYTAYDKDGTLITGTMASLSSSNLSGSGSADGSITSVSITAGSTYSAVGASDEYDESKTYYTKNDDTYNADSTVSSENWNDKKSSLYVEVPNSIFNVTGSGNVSGSATVTVGSTGYITADTSKTVDVSGTASVSDTIRVVKLGGSASGDGTVTPVISKGTSCSKAGDITTTAPTTGAYVSVSTAAIEKTATVSPSVTTAGYGTTSVYEATDVNVTAGAAASGTYYVPISSGSVTAYGSISGDGISPEIAFTNSGYTVTSGTAAADTGISTAGILTTAPDSGSYIVIDAASEAKSSTVSGTVNVTVGEGYVYETDATSKTVSTTITAAAANKKQYIKVYDGSYIG